MINYDFRSIHNRSDFDFKVEIDLLRGGFEVHTHSFYELVIILGGHGIHNINHEKHFIKRGDVFILMPHTSHYFSDNENLFVCNIMFANLDSIMSLDDYKLLPGFHTLFVLSPHYTKESTFSSYLHLSHESTHYIEELAKRLLNEYTSANIGYKTMCYTLFSEMVIFLSREYATSNNTFSSPELMSMGRTMAYIENHFTEDLTIDELATMAGVSIRHFNRIFKQLYNDTPLNYILCLRIKYACHLLKESPLTISEVAYSCGFNDSNYFTRYFKQVMSYTPLKFRHFYHANQKKSP